MSVLDEITKYISSIPNFMSDKAITSELTRARVLQKRMEEKFGYDGGVYWSELLILDHRIKHLREEVVKRGLEND